MLNLHETIENLDGNILHIQANKSNNQYSQLRLTGTLLSGNTYLTSRIFTY